MRPTRIGWRRLGGHAVCGGSLVLASMTACRVKEAAPRSAVVLDATGATIVENARAAWPDGSGWLLSEQPALDIGVFEGDPNYQLDQVRGVVRLSDGRIVVANAGTEQLRFFGPDGRFIQATGGKGRGPGEFDGLMTLRRYGGDSLLTFDFRQRRISIFDPRGTYLRSAPLVWKGSGFAGIVGLLPQGQVLAQARSHLGPGQHIQDGVRRDSILLLRFGSDGRLADTLGAFPGTEWYTEVTRDATGKITSTESSAVPLARYPAMATTAQGFYFGANDAYEIGAYRADGALVRVIRLDRPGVPVTREAAERYREDRLSGPPDANVRRAQERMFAKVPFPATLPPHGPFVVDEAGCLWVAESRLPGDTLPRWTIIDSTGMWLGSVGTPPSFIIYQIGVDFVLGVWRDKDGIEQVRMYGLKRET